MLLVDDWRRRGIENGRFGTVLRFTGIGTDVGLRGMGLWPGAGYGPEARATTVAGGAGGRAFDLFVPGR